MAAMYPWMTFPRRRAALGVLLLLFPACATPQGQGGESIEWKTGSKTGNPFEIRLTVSGSELKALLVNLSKAEQMLVHDTYLQASVLELVPSNAGQHKPYDSRMIKKYDATPYCRLFLTLAPGKKLVLGSVRFKKSRDGYAGDWGPFHFDEMPAGDYRAQVTWQNERTQCLDEDTRQMRKFPSLWRGRVLSNQVTLRLE